MIKTRFNASWGKSLKIKSCIGIALCLSVSGACFIAAHHSARPLLINTLGPLIPLVIGVFAALSCVRGYEIVGDTLFVIRPGWVSTISLAEFISVACDPLAMAGSIRTFGNGGLFSFTGLFWNRALGSYRAYVTDQEKCVVIKFRNRVVVVSPDSPEQFAQAVLLSYTPSK